MNQQVGDDNAHFVASMKEKSWYIKVKRRREGHFEFVFFVVYQRGELKGLYFPILSLMMESGRTSQNCEASWSWRYDDMGIYNWTKKKKKGKN